MAWEPPFPSALYEYYLHVRVPLACFCQQTVKYINIAGKHELLAATLTINSKHSRQIASK